jgi:hypothetical protein
MASAVQLYKVVSNKYRSLKIPLIHLVISIA